MSLVTRRLWLIRETEKARLYSKTPPDRDPDEIWIPKSVIRKALKFPSGEHHVELEDWFAEKENI